MENALTHESKTDQPLKRTRKIKGTKVPSWAINEKRGPNGQEKGGKQINDSLKLKRHKWRGWG